MTPEQMLAQNELVKGAMKFERDRIINKLKETKTFYKATFGDNALPFVPGLDLAIDMIEFEDEK